MQGGEAQGNGVADPPSSDNPDSAQPPRTRDRKECPLNKLSVRLLETYNNINQRYYEQRKVDAKKKKRKSRYNSKEYDYQVVEGAHLGENDRYKVDKEIGKGSFGKVVRAFDKVEKEFVAIKIVKKKKAFLKQAETEIKILRALQEPNEGDEPAKIVQMKNYFKHEKHQCIVFELLYRNLYELLIDTQYKGVSLNLVRKFGKQILSTLNFLRKRKVIHCDLKPENVLMRHKNRSGIKVIDFGSACFSNEKAFTYIQSRFYRAPEVLLGIEYSFPIDMWSLGCMLVEMHTGKPLFPGRNENDQICKQVEVLGMPPDWMIETGKYGTKHFTKQRDDDGRVRWVSTSATPHKISFASIMEEAKRLNKGKRGHGEKDYERFENLLRSMLDYNFRKRMTPEEALRHSFLRSFQDSCTSTEVSYLSRGGGSRGGGDVKTNRVQSDLMDASLAMQNGLAINHTSSTQPQAVVEAQEMLASASMEVEKKDDNGAMQTEAPDSKRHASGSRSHEATSSTSAALPRDARGQNHVGTQANPPPTQDTVARNNVSHSTTYLEVKKSHDRRDDNRIGRMEGMGWTGNFGGSSTLSVNRATIRSGSCNSGGKETNSRQASPMII